MKLTPELKEYVLDNIQRASNLMEVNPRTNIFLTTKDLIKFANSNGIRIKRNPDKVFGLHSAPKDLLFINVEKFKTIKRMNMTIIHELLHNKGKKRHTKKFHEEVTRYLNMLWDDGKTDFDYYQIEDRYNW